MTDYVLYVYGAALFGAGYAFAWSLGGQRAKLALSLGLYALAPSYTPPSRTWRREQADHRRRDRSHDFDGWHDLIKPPPAGEPDPAAFWTSAAPTVVLPVVPGPRLVRAEIDQPGAEHWGDLLTDMNTEERTVFSAELLETYEATKAIERPFLDDLDAAIERFTAAMGRLDRRTEAAFVGVGANLLRGHGGPDRWSTGQFPVLEAPPATS